MRGTIWSKIRKSLKKGLNTKKQSNTKKKF